MNKNKGFSLVELIVVVAIMAVLVGILAPAYLSYVEKTRRGTDENMAEEVRHSVEISTADICVYDSVMDAMGDSNSKYYDITDGNAINTIGTTQMQAALADVYAGKEFDCKSKKYNGKTYRITITANGANGAALDVTGEWQ